MRLLIISHVLHKPMETQWFAYAPYVREMNLWLKYVDAVEIVAPKVDEQPSVIDMGYKHDNIYFNKIPSIAFINLKSIISSIVSIPNILIALIAACKRADHIHLRCPGNIGLLGCLVQMFFSKKIKTAKYAGNWNLKAKQPLSYRLQKWILSNTFLTKNMTVLVYGEWENQSKNIKPFFTASYKKEEIQKSQTRTYADGLKFIFVGSLVEGKRPLLAIQIVEAFQKGGKKSTLDIYGDGILKATLKQYISENSLEKQITLHGNQNNDVIKHVLQSIHFLILPSKSEGWPKAIAEAMFYGVIPISTEISCVPYMLDYGNRGVLIEPNVETAVLKIMKVLDTDDLCQMSKLASQWSQTFTLEYFESEIKKLLIH